jgi:acetyltransferase-like isoleucine patch superfamily enzyme
LKTLVNGIYFLGFVASYNGIYLLGDMDTMIGEFSTLYPSAVISGNVKIGQECEFGANSCVLQDVTIADRVKVGAGAVVTKTINEEGSTYTGVPARKKI